MSSRGARGELWWKLTTYKCEACGGRSKPRDNERYRNDTLVTEWYQKLGGFGAVFTVRCPHCGHVEQMLGATPH